jgi:hypothetical protein
VRRASVGAGLVTAPYAHEHAERGSDVVGGERRDARAVGEGGDLGPARGVAGALHGGYVRPVFSQDGLGELIEDGGYLVETQLVLNYCFVL